MQRNRNVEKCGFNVEHRLINIWYYSISKKGIILYLTKHFEIKEIEEMEKVLLRFQVW
jgi:hypothetical protein